MHAQSVLAGSRAVVDRDRAARLGVARVSWFAHSAANSLNCSQSHGGLGAAVTQLMHFSVPGFVHVARISQPS